MQTNTFARYGRASIWLLCILVAPITAHGQGYGPIRWDYVTASLVVPDLDEIGLELDGSTAVTPSLVVFGAYRNYEPRSRIEREMYQIGVGRRWNIRPNIDVMGSVSYADNSIKTRGVNADDSGIILGGHVRGWITQRVELNGAVQLDHSTGSNTDTVLEVGMQFFADRNISYGGRLRSDEEDQALFLGARFYFGASRR
jgi:hypothetical protein